MEKIDDTRLLWRSLLVKVEELRGIHHVGPEDTECKDSLKMLRERSLKCTTHYAIPCALRKILRGTSFKGPKDPKGEKL